MDPKVLGWCDSNQDDVTKPVLSFHGFGFLRESDGLHFDGLNSINQSCSEACRLSRTSWSILVSVKLRISQYSKQSSANIQTVDQTLLNRSFMYTRNNRGPVTVPCGTPDDPEDVWPSSTTSWVHPCKKSVIRLRMEFLMPQCSNFRSRREWDTLSDALEKSRRMASIWLELSTLLARSLTVSISCVPQDLFFGKPCCQLDKISCRPRCFMMLLCTICSMTCCRQRWVKWDGNCLGLLCPLS